MKSKVRAVQEVETCGHPADRLQTGANQHAAWENCLDCHQRWALPKQSSSKETKPQKSTAASSAKERFSVVKMQEEAMEKAAQEVKSLWKTELAQEMSHLRGSTQTRLEQQEATRQEMMRHIQQREEEYQIEMHEAKKNFLELQRKAEMGEVMMSEYASMAIGKDYQEKKGYHDGEMEMYAIKRLERELEIRRCEQVEMEIAEERAKEGVARSLGVRKKSKSPARSKAHGHE
jgi:hypothetical protein